MHTKSVFKRIILLLFVVLLGLGLFHGYVWYKGKGLLFPSLEREQNRPLWVADKPVPETVRPDFYLAALNAVFEENPVQAANYYLKALKGDPDNLKLLREAYFYNAILGNFEELKPFVDTLPPVYQSVFFTNYLKVVYAFQEKNWGKMREQLKNQSATGLDAIVYPLLEAWSYAGEGNYEEAMKAIEKLKEQEGLESYYYYHKGLISGMLGQVFAADEAFQGLAQKSLPSFSLYPEIRSFYVRQGSWQASNPFFLQWQIFAAEQPATAELIMQAPAKGITPAQGIAEVFYSISTAMGSSLDNYESALILSALSLYVNPNQNLPKIWSAEILEQVKKFHLAAFFYDRLEGVISQTVDYKKAMNLLACKRGEEAKSILFRLKQTNQQNVSLWWALASVYQDEKNWPEALKTYTHILEIVDVKDSKKLSDVYFARAFIYGEQKQNQKVQSDLQKALELNPDNPMLLNHLGYLWLESGEKTAEGTALVEKAYKLRPSDPYIMDSMAFAYYRQKDYTKALPLAEKTVDIMPQSSVANAHLGDIYDGLGRHREAVFQYKKALTLKYDLTPELTQELQKKIAEVGKK